MSFFRASVDRVERLLTLIQFGVAIGLLLVASLVIYDLSELRRATGAVQQEQARLRGLNRLAIVCIDAETGVRGYLLTKDENMLQPYYSALSRYELEIAGLLSIQREDEFSHLISLAKAYITFCSQSVNEAKAQSPDFSVIESTYNGKRLLDSFRAEQELWRNKVFDSLSAANERLLYNQRKAIFIELIVCSIMLVVVVATGLVTWSAKLERKKRTEALQRARDYAESIINTIHEPLLVLNADLKIITANKAFYMHFQANPSQIIDKPIDSIPETAWFNDTLKAAVADVLENATSFSILIEHKAPYIGTRKLQVDIRKIYRPGNHTTTVLCLLNDITEQTRMEEALREVNTQLTSFAYSVAHDLRAPLRAMQGFSQALVEDFGHLLPKEGKEYTDRIIAASSRMDRLIRDLLDYSRLSRDEVALAPVNLNDVFQEVRSQCLRECPVEGADILLPDNLPSVMGARSILLQIFTNLVSNALKFVPKGSIPQVKIKSELHNRMIRIWVEDNGIGIPVAHLERIFGVFERLHGVDQYPGTGIGLAIVRKGAERLGGKAGVLSELGKGSRFWVEIPPANISLEPTPPPHFPPQLSQHHDRT